VKAASLGVLQEPLVQPGLEGIGQVHDNLGVVGDENAEDPAVE
jgi:hypothetical protein